MVEIIGLLEAGSSSLTNIQQQLGIPFEDIFNVYNACLSLGLIKFNPDAKKGEKQTTATEEDGSKKTFGGFFKRKKK